MSSSVRPFLKWLGGKYRLRIHLNKLLPNAKTLIEPFVGSGAVFLNTNYEKYILNDINPDLINLYISLQQEGHEFIGLCREYFDPKYNKPKYYYQFRKEFNNIDDYIEKSALFLYLNRHGYNGLCRYSQGKREFNVPFGSYDSPYFPQKEMEFFYKKSKHAKFVCEDFSQTLRRARKDHVVYCDPPYVPLSKTSNFTGYHSGSFTLQEQLTLAKAAKRIGKRGIPVLISNHDTEFTREAYIDANIYNIKVNRSISCKGDRRVQAKELLALFLAD